MEGITVGCSGAVGVKAQTTASASVHEKTADSSSRGHVVT